MTRRFATSLALASLVPAGGCNGDGKAGDTPPTPLTDTGWFDTETIEEPPPCEDRLVAYTPESGDEAWYYRTRPEVYVETPVPEAYGAWLVREDTGERLDYPLVWDETGLSFTLELPPSGLVGDTPYVLWLSDCAETVEVPFRTGPLGVPLEIDAEALAGRTYLLGVSGATWEQPPKLGALIGEVFTTPLLLSVRYADGGVIDLIGAPGVIDPFGNVAQDPVAPTWDFPVADFETSPFLDVAADLVELGYSTGTDEVVIPVHDFLLQATFSADGAELGGGVLSGVGDTRDFSAQLLGSEQGACNIVEPLGIPCIPCPDGLAYCLELQAVDLSATWIPGLVLVER